MAFACVSPAMSSGRRPPREPLRDDTQQVVANRVPSVSLMRLNWSRSRNMIANDVPPRLALSSVSASFSWKRERFGSSVTTSK